MHYRRWAFLFFLSFILSTVSLSTVALAADPTSPRVEALKKDVAAGNSAAIEAFWAKAQVSGAPLVESSDVRDHKLVTFLFRGNADASNVVVVTPLSLIDINAAKLTHIDGTDVWYRTYEMPNDARFTYRFAINDSLVSFEKETNFFGRMKDWKRDPLNQKTFEVFQGIVASVLALPNAPADAAAHVRSETAKGIVEEQTFHSAALNADVKLWVYQPAKSNPSGSLPVVVFNDGDSYKDLMSTPVILDNLIADGAIPPVVAVFVPNLPDGREKYLNCNRAWSDFEATELLSWLRTKYKVSGDASQHVIAGYSLGGLAAGCAGESHPEAFGRVLAQSGSFFRAPEGEAPEWLARTLAQEQHRNQSWYLEIGQLETAAIPSRDPSMLTASRHLRDVLMARGYEVTYAERYNGHEHVAWRATLPVGLKTLLKPNTHSVAAK